MVGEHQLGNPEDVVHMARQKSSDFFCGIGLIMRYRYRVPREATGHHQQTIVARVNVHNIHRLRVDADHAPGSSTRREGTWGVVRLTSGPFPALAVRTPITYAVNHLPHIVHRTPEETTAQHPELHVFAGVIVGVMPLNQRPEYVCARLRNHHGVAKFGVVHLQLTSTVDTIGFLR